MAGGSGCSALDVRQQRGEVEVIHALQQAGHARALAVELVAGVAAGAGLCAHLDSAGGHVDEPVSGDAGLRGSMPGSSLFTRGRTATAAPLGLSSITH